MILRDNNSRSTEGSLGGETITMGISDIRLIIDRLTDLYSDRELACLREYSTNARDAHIEAGVNAPIEVSTPGPLAPFLTIRDFGVGLSVEDIREIYSQYGASTKRNTNDQTGALGLGCKSALSYSDQFTVTSVKDGVQIQVVVSRDPKAGATMKVVDTCDSSEPNGTTILIPARSYNHFEQKARDFFKFWEPGTVKLNGVEPEKLPGAKWVSDDIALIDGYQNYIVMGGVPYPTSDLNTGLVDGPGVAAFVPIGAVDFAPSREALMDTAETTATLRRVEKDIRAKIAEAVTKDIEAASTPYEAVKRRMEWADKLPGTLMPSVPTYKGKVIPSMIQYPDGTMYASLSYRKMSAYELLKPDRGLPVATAQRALIVYGFDYASFTATVRKKLEKYVNDNGLDIRGGYVLMPTQLSALDRTWLPADQETVDWPTVKALKLPRASNGAKLASGRIPGSYDIWENGDYNEGVPGDDIDTSHPVLWLEGGSRYYSGRSMAEWLTTQYPKGYTLVILQSTRIAKFQRNFPNALKARDVAKAAYTAWEKKVDAKLCAAIVARGQLDARLDLLPLDKLDDPDLKAAVKCREIDTASLEAEIAAWRSLDFHYDVNVHGGAKGDPLGKYILLPEAYYFRNYQPRNPGFMDHVVRYMNAEYAATKA